MAKLNPLVTSQYKTKPADSATEGHNIQLLPTRWSEQFKDKIQNLLYLLSWSLMWPVVKLGDSDSNIIPHPCSRNNSRVFGGRFRGISPLARVLPVSFSCEGLPTPTTLHITGKRRQELRNYWSLCFTIGTQAAASSSGPNAGSSCWFLNNPWNSDHLFRVWVPDKLKITPAL